MRLEASPLPVLGLSFSICHASGLGQVFCSVLLNSGTALLPWRLESGPLCLGSTHSSGAQLLAVKQAGAPLWVQPETSLVCGRMWLPNTGAESGFGGRTVARPVDTVRREDRSPMSSHWVQ